MGIMPRLSSRGCTGSLLYLTIVLVYHAELGRNPVSKHQSQPEYGDEQADAGRDC